jgi:hypothetical protein
MKNEYFKSGTVFLMLFFTGLAVYSKNDTAVQLDTSLINNTLKQVLQETKKGLSREQISLTIIISIVASAMAIIIFMIRKRIRENFQSQNKDQ